MDYKKRYNLAKGIKWIIKRVKTERWVGNNRADTVSGKLMSAMRQEIYEEVLKNFRRNK